MESRSSKSVEDNLYSLKTIKTYKTEHKFVKLCVTTHSSLAHETRSKEPWSNPKHTVHVLDPSVQVTSL